MTVSVSWDNPEKSIIRYDFENPWTLSEFTSAVDAAVEMAHMSDQPADLILNQPGPIPDKIAAYLQRGINRFPEKAWVVIIDDSHLLESMIEAVARFNPTGIAQVKVVNSLAAAYDFLDTVRSSEAIPEQAKTS